jgi:uncharacterized protein (TIGR02569 family)
VICLGDDGTAPNISTAPGLYHCRIDLAMTIEPLDSVAPSNEVLGSFGLTGDLTPVTGGRGLCFRVGDAILKPADDEDEAQDVSELAVKVLDRNPSQYRLARPLYVVNDSATYVFQGWTASSFLEASPGPKVRYADIFKVNRAFCADLAVVCMDKPSFVEKRSDRWSEADRVTWGENSLADVEKVDSKILRLISPVLEALKKLMKPLPLDLKSQLIHADLGGNVLFDENNASLPGIIDLTLYWRPPAYAEAVVVADSLVWAGEGGNLVELYGLDEVRLQLAVRAMYWRNLTFAIDPAKGWTPEYVGSGNHYKASKILEEYVVKK